MILFILGIVLVVLDLGILIWGLIKGLDYTVSSLAIVGLIAGIIILILPLFV